MTTSRIPGFYNLTLDERLAKLAEVWNLTPKLTASLLPMAVSPPRQPTT